MKRRSIGIIIGSIPFALLVALAQEPAPQGSKLETLRAGYQSRKLVVETETSQKITELAAQYTLALDKLIEQKSAGGDLDVVIAIRAEKEALKDPLRLPLLRDSPVELERLRGTFVSTRDRIVQSSMQRVAELDSIYLGGLSELETQLTKEKKLEDALAVQAEKLRFEELGNWEQLPTVIVGSLSNAVATAELTK